MSHAIKYYDYTDESGALLFQVVRFFPKDFRQRHVDPENPKEWIWNMQGVRRVLYRLPAVTKERQLILLCEGEKDVETAEKMGFVATTAPMGAGKWCEEYTQMLKGVDTVVIFADHDEPGERDALQKAEALRGAVTHIKIIRFLIMPEHSDLTDWYRSHKSKIALSRQLTNMIHDAPDWTPPPTSQETLREPAAATKSKTILSLSDFLLRFDGVKETKSGFQAKCPAHDDQHASLSIAEKSGKILLKCHAGCETKTIVDTVGLSLADLFLESNRIRAGNSAYQFVKFWYEVTINEGQENERIELKIDYRLFLQFLEKNGFGLLIQAKDVELIHVRDNIVSHTLEKRTTNVTVKQFTLEYLRKLGQTDVENLMLQRHGTFFTEAFLTSLRPIEREFYRDTASMCCFFFANGFVKIVKQGDTSVSSFEPYDKLTGLIWDTQIQKRHYLGTRTANPVNPTYEGECEFGDFLRLVSTKQTQDGTTITTMTNYTPFVYGYGFLLHHYKDVANARAILVVDDNPGENANGRRGKSLFCKAFSEFRKVTYEDGRTIKTDNNQFVMQSVENDSQVLLINDIKKGFDFTLFYPFITDDANQERKHEGRKFLSFYDTPKLLLTSNYVIGGIGDSDVARWYILPFVSYFSPSYTPMDEFEHRLFDDWNEVEWNNFFDFTIDCMEKYLQFQKPPDVDLTDYHESKLQSALAEELFSFLEIRFDRVSHGVPYEYPKKQLFVDFVTEYPVYGEQGRKWTQKFFSEKLTIYCKMRNYEINPDRTDGRYWKTDSNGDKEEYLMVCKKKTP